VKIANTNICGPECPSGFEVKDLVAFEVCDGPYEMILNMVIENVIATNRVSTVNDFIILGGPDGITAEKIPQSVKNRGIWFDGVNDIMTIDPGADPLFRINPSNSVEFWTRPVADFGTLFSIYDPTIPASGVVTASRYILSTESVPETGAEVFKLELFGRNGQQAPETVTVNEVYDLNDQQWILFGLSMTSSIYTGYTTTVNFYRFKTIVKLYTTDLIVLDDTSVDYQYILGA
jgi:hypothetical protein